MFMFDIETLGIESNSAILSMACIHFDPKTQYTYEQLLESAFFVKLNAVDQMGRLERTSTKSTMEWWANQIPEVRATSFAPKSTDLLAEDAIQQLRMWAAQFEDFKNGIIWARGNLDQMALGSLELACDLPTIFYHNRWRDVRTAVDLMTGSSNGYCDIKDFDKEKVVKHDPRHDCAYDIMMLLYGSK